jgi:thiol-disulfide isomerase/thioredoxin
MGEFRYADYPVTRAAQRIQLRFVPRLTLGVLVMLLVVGCDSERRSDRGTNPARQRSSGVATPQLKVGDPLPPLQADGWLNGSPVAPNAPGVRLLVVDAWGPWCPFCAKSAPDLLRVYEKYAGQGVAFVSLTASDHELVEHHVRKFSVPWPNGYGVTPEMVAALGVGSGMPGPIDYEVAPTLYLVSTDGLVRWVDGRGRARHMNPQEWAKGVDAAIADALESTPAEEP